MSVMNLCRCLGLLLSLASAVQPPHGALRAHPRLRVALAAVVPYGSLNSSSWRDALAVLALSAQQVAAQSAHRTELLALMPDSLPDHDAERCVLEAMGVTARFVPVPVPLDQVRNSFARGELAKVLGEMEQLKYYGAALTEYDRVVVLDADTMFLKPIDELFVGTGKSMLSGIYDYELDIPSSAFAPLNTGFLSFTPNKADFDRITEIVREGDFRPGTGWQGSNTGWTYGTGSQGVLSFYYNQVQPGKPGFNSAVATKGKDLPGLNFTRQPPSSRFRPLDRSVYNVVDTELLLEAVHSGHTDASRVKVFHFTGRCPKPWLCSPPPDPFCAEMQDRWWDLRADLAGPGSAKRCPNGGYRPLPLPRCSRGRAAPAASVA